jgi:hypothetical protein
MPDDESYAKGYLKGYEDGLKEAWEDLIALTMKGYTSREIQILAKSRRSDVPQKIEIRKKRLVREMGLDLEVPSTRKTAEPGPSKDITTATTEPLAYAPGVTTIIHDFRLDAPIILLKEQLGLGRSGLCIVRTPPESIKKKHGIECQMVWLTRTIGVEATGDNLPDQVPFVSPTDLAKISAVIKTFSTKNAGGTILLEGLEYLISQNDARDVLRFLSAVRDQVYLSKAFLMLPIDPTVFDDRDLKALEREGGEE